MFEIFVMKRKIIFFVDSIYIWSSFNAILCQGLMLHDTFENRKSYKIWPHESSTLFSNESSSLYSLSSITSPCFDIFRKHLKGISQTFRICVQFSEKDNSFLKRLRFFHFSFVCLLNIFSSDEQLKK